MEFRQILERFAEGLVSVDTTTTHESANQRSGELYLPGVKTLREPKFVEEILNWWRLEHSSDFNPASASDREVPYPEVSRASCDLVFSTDGSPLSKPEWSIEVKHIALVGNNGKNNDYGVPKILSPYLKDRSLIHDIHRMRKHPIGKRQGVIGYCFEYSFGTCDEAFEKHPEHTEYINNVRAVCKSNDPSEGRLSALSMAEFANKIFVANDLVKPMQVVEFSNAWRHPCGGRGNIFGWEVLPK